MKRDDEKITVIIPNWRKYQRQLKGNTKRRSWFAVSANIARDPDFMSLSVADRYGWLMLLADASLRGVEQESGECWLELRIKLFRSLYGLRSNFVLQPLIDHGFITTIHNNTVLRTTEHDISEQASQQTTKKPYDTMARFAEKPFNPRECPPNYQPSAELIEKIRQHHPNLTDADFAEGLRQMKAHVYEQDVFDWNRKYQNWMNEYRRRNGQTKQGSKRKTFDEIRAEQLKKMGGDGEGYEPGEGSVVATY